MSSLSKILRFLDKELGKIKELCDALAPVEYLCKKKTTDLLLAENITEFAAKNLRDQDMLISLALLEKFKI